MKNKQIKINLPSAHRQYDIVIGNGLLKPLIQFIKKQDVSHIVIITDSKVRKLYGDKLLKDLKNNIQVVIKHYQDRTIELHTLMKSQYKKILNIKKNQERFRTYSPDDVTENQKKYNEGLSILSQALKLIEDQGEASLKLSERYTALIEQKEETLVLATFMLQELDLIGVWHRSNRAVTWDGIKQIIPNLITFAQNAYGVISDYIINFHLFKDLYEFVTTSTSQLFSYILFSIFLYIIFLCLQAILPALFTGLMLISPDMQGLFLLSRIFAVICGFLQKCLGLIFVWLLIFACLSFYQFSIAFTLIFYGCSIVFLTYISRTFLAYLLEFNRSIDFLLLGESFEDRFAWIFSFFSSSTIFILFFRKMSGRSFKTNCSDSATEVGLGAVSGNVISPAPSVIKSIVSGSLFGSG